MPVTLKLGVSENLLLERELDKTKLILERELDKIKDYLAGNKYGIRNYGVTDINSRPEKSRNGENFYLEDKLLSGYFDPYHLVARICIIGQVSKDYKKKEISVRVYGKDYFKRIHNDFKNYNDSDITINLIQDKDAPEYVCRDDRESCLT